MVFASEVRQLCHGISFSQHEPEPTLRLRRGDEWSNEPLRANRSLSLTVGEQKFCLGYITMNADGSRDNHPCPKHKAVRTGTQCDFCQRRDQSKFMHHFHKTGEAPAGMRTYLEQPHFLYVASFAHGATKVGTTSVQSKWSRLAQQGVVVARYVAGAADGAAIRVLEDLVTEHVGLGQQVRQKSKIKGLTSWELNLDGLEKINQSSANQTREFLAAQRGLETYGIEVLDQRWQQPDYAQAVIEAWDIRSLHPWDQKIVETTLKLRIRGVLGQSLMVDSGPSTTLRLIDAAELKTRELKIAEELGDFQEAQSALF
ncbi:DUF2797 domain-containing protein [Glutamicibacter sp. NPDC087344]|uniref:DUF2797 domain-containing protein n=1 Tax=Glutamicibacter sp. NPDC087344 TaxID=3363994 RepID=UPI00381C28E8